MTDALTSMESWMRALRMSLTDVSLALHGNAVPDAVPPEALAKLRCTLFAANNALDELVDQLKGPYTADRSPRSRAPCDRPSLSKWRGTL
jgi:hypothetical protein